MDMSHKLCIGPVELDLNIELYIRDKFTSVAFSNNIGLQCICNVPYLDLYSACPWFGTNNIVLLIMLISIQLWCKLPYGILDN